MRSRGVPRGRSLAARLLALVVVPIVALSALSLSRVDAKQASADHARRLVDSVQFQQIVTAVYPPSQLERTTTEGLARIDELGLPRDIVVSLTGLDLESVSAANVVKFEGALDDLDELLSSGAMAGTGDDLLRLREVRSELSALRADSDAGLGTTDRAQVVFGHLDDLLESILGQLEAGPDGTTTFDRQNTQLGQLTNVLIGAGRQSRSDLRAILYQTPEFQREATQGRAIHQANLDAFAATLTPSQRTAFSVIRARADAIPEIPVPDDAGLDQAVMDPALIIQSAAVILGDLGYMNDLEAYSVQFHQAILDDVGQAASLAQTEADRTTWLLVAVVVITVLLAAAVVWSILAPVRTLSRRAQAISRGQLHQEALPLRGPNDLRALTASTNEMVATLDRMRRAVEQLAAGDVDLAVATDLPGAIGVSMRESMRRLADVTTQLQRSEQFASAIVAHAADAIWTIDDQGRISSANAATEALTGVDAAQQWGRPLSDFLSTTSGEGDVHHADQEIRVIAALSDVDIDGERIRTVIAHDISERTRFERQLAHQASHDALTGLPNRFSLLQHLDEVIRTPTTVAVLFVDLDSFKNVNDTKGHAVGDHVLAEVARHIRDCVPPDAFVGRLGGDEFVIVTERGADVKNVVALGERIIRAVEVPHRLGDQTFALSASVGIALPHTGTSALDMIRQADNAVYQAKQRGRGRVELFDPSMQRRVEREAALEFDLRNGVRNGELVLHLQPVIDLASGATIGVEALVRWARPGHGLLAPSEFIPIAERSTLIFDVERWVLAEACRLMVEWRRRDPTCNLRIAVNIAGRHLIEGGLVDDVLAALALYGADPKMLELELTETQLLEDLVRATTSLQTLRSLGITIAVDDFGTGYSSMTYLRHLPIDSVKIDRSFVARSTENGYDSTVIEALLKIGRGLGLAVVAEGVETVEQLEYLRARGCDRAQGYLLARPMPVAELETLLFSMLPA